MGGLANIPVGYVNAGFVSQWDGSNEAAVVDWLNDGFADPAQQVTVAFTDGAHLVLNAPGNPSGGQTLVVPALGYVARAELIPGVVTPPSPNGATAVIVDAAKFWYATTDGSGRPVAAADIEAV